MKIRETDHITYSLFPTVYRPQLEEIFKAQGLEYKLYAKGEFPEGVQCALDLEGHIYKDFLYCLESKMEPEDVHMLVLKLWHPSKYGAISSEPQVRE